MTKGWEKTAEEAEVTLWLPGEVPVYFRKIPAGSFRMGARGYGASEEPVTEVVMPEPFYLAAFPVTQGQWRAVVEAMDEGYPGAHDLRAEPSHFKGDDLLPVEQVNWKDAQAWMDFIVTHREGFRWEGVEGKIWLPLRLPCEAEWEYACRAGTETEYYTGDEEEALAEAGWFGRNSGSETHPVGEKQANVWGLHDMHGNVWEWCEDVWGDNLDDENRAYAIRADGEEFQRDELDIEGEALRVLRGGSWYFSARNCRAAFRGSRRPGLRFRFVGFRLGLFPGPVPARRAGAEPAPGAGSEGTERKAEEAGGADGIDLSRERL